jgi:hypothetical protein
MTAATAGYSPCSATCATIADGSLYLLREIAVKEPGIVCELGVADIAKSIAFYERLGFERIEVDSVDGSLSWAELAFCGSRLMRQEIGGLADHLPGIARTPAKRSNRPP